MRLKNKKSVPPLSIGENTFPIIMLWYDLHICIQTAGFCLTVGAVYRSQELYVNATLFEDEVIPVVVINDTYGTFLYVAVVALAVVFA